MKSKYVLALSGGLDSVVLGYKLQKENIPFRCVATDFGSQNSQRELKSAKYFASLFEVNLEIIDVSGLGPLVNTFGFIGLLDGGDTHDPDPGGDADIRIYGSSPGQPYAPTGFYVNLAIMTFYARLVGIETLALGITKDDMVGRPNLATYLNDWAKMIPQLEMTSKHSENKDKLLPPTFKIETPLANLTKTEIVDLGTKLNVPLDTTYSCYNGRTLHCGKCGACISRMDAFKRSNLAKDPTWYEELPNVGRLSEWNISKK